MTKEEARLYAKYEEMAKEYVIETYGLRSDLEIWRIKQDEDLRKDFNAFLAGLEAGRPKWHKVADGDLPKEQKEYWCKVFFYESEETFNAFLWFDPSTKDFKFFEEIEENVGSTFKVKAWCEIPPEE